MRLCSEENPSAVCCLSMWFIYFGGAGFQYVSPGPACKKAWGLGYLRTEDPGGKIND